MGSKSWPCPLSPFYFPKIAGCSPIEFPSTTSVLYIYVVPKIAFFLTSVPDRQASWNSGVLVPVPLLPELCLASHQSNLQRRQRALCVSQGCANLQLGFRILRVLGTDRRPVSFLANPQGFCSLPHLVASHFLQGQGEPRRPR